MSTTSLREDALAAPAPSDPEGTPTGSTEELDDVEQQVSEREWVVKGVLKGIVNNQELEQAFERRYVQKPLSYLAMIQFTGLLGRKMDDAMSGPEGFSVESLGDLASAAMVARDGPQAFLAQADFSGVDAFLRGFAKLAAYTPDIIAEAQCIWLRIPLRDRMSVIEIWSKPLDEGGLSMDDGEGMLDLFIHQNYEELERFFVERWRRILRRVQTERQKRHQSAD